MTATTLSRPSGYANNGRTGSNFMYRENHIGDYHNSNKRDSCSHAPIKSETYADNADEVKVNVFSQWLEAIFTLSIIFSTALMPFVLMLLIGPVFSQELIVACITPPLVYLSVPYIIIMVLVGAKISSLFGCSLWNRLISDKE